MPPSHRDTARALPPTGLHMFSKHVHTHALTHVYMGPSTYLHVCVWCVQMHSHVHTYTCVSMCAYTLICVCTVCTHEHACALTHVHTHAPVHKLTCVCSMRLHMCRYMSVHIPAEPHRGPGAHTPQWLPPHPGFLPRS